MKDSLVDLADNFMRKIVKAADAESDIGVLLDVQRELIRWVQVKNKVEPEGAEGSKIDEYRAALKGSGASGNTGRGRGRPTSAEKIARLEEGQNEAKVPSGVGFRKSGTPATDTGNLSGDISRFVSPVHNGPIPINGISAGPLGGPIGGVKKSDSFGGV